MPILIGWGGFLIALAALIYAWTQQQRINTIERRLDRYNKALFDANNETRALREQLESAVAQLKIAIKQSQGAAAFTPDMSVQEAQMAHPQAQRLMASLGLGGCSTCAEDSLTIAARDHGVNLEQLLTHLNALANGSHGGVVNPVKIPNVQFQLE